MRIEKIIVMDGDECLTRVRNCHAKSPRFLRTSYYRIILRPVEVLYHEFDCVIRNSNSGVIESYNGWWQYT